MEFTPTLLQSRAPICLNFEGLPLRDALIHIYQQTLGSIVLTSGTSIMSFTMIYDPQHSTPRYPIEFNFPSKLVH